MMAQKLVYRDLKIIWLSRKGDLKQTQNKQRAIRRKIFNYILTDPLF